MSINPENNLKVRSVLYVIGTMGFIHLVALLISSIIKGDGAIATELFAMDYDKTLPEFLSHPLLYSLGWIVFFSSIYLVYRYLNKKSTQKE